MSETVMMTMLITLTDGSKRTFQYPRQSGDEFSVVRKTQEALAADQVMIEAEGKVHVFPFSSILSIEVSPLPVKLPPNCIRGAVLL